MYIKENLQKHIQCGAKVGLLLLQQQQNPCSFCEPLGKIRTFSGKVIIYWCQDYRSFFILGNTKVGLQLFAFKEYNK